MADTYRWELIVDDNGSPKLMKMGDEAEKMGAKSEKAGQRVKKMGQDVKDTEEHLSGMGKATEVVSESVKSLAKEWTSGFSEMASQAGSVALGNLGAEGLMKVGESLLEAAHGALEFGASIGDMSERLGVSTDDLQVLGAWADQSGTDLDTLAKAMGKLTIKIADGDAVLKRHGITSIDAKTAFMQVADAVEHASTQSEKAKIANAAFGKSWQEIMPVLKMGREEMEKVAGSMIMVSEEDITKLKALDDQLKAMSNTSRGLAAELMAAFGPSMTELVSGMATEMRNLNDKMQKESDSDFLTRIGAKKSWMPGAYTIPKSVSPDQMSSADLQTVMDQSPSKNGFSMDMSLTTFEDPSAWTNLESKYAKALTREREAKAKAEEEDRQKRLQQQKEKQKQDEDDSLRAEDAAREKEEAKKTRELQRLHRLAEHVDLPVTMLQQGDFNRDQDAKWQDYKEGEFSPKPKERYGSSLGKQMDQYGWRNADTFTYATDGGMNQLDLGTATPSQMRAAVEEAKKFQDELGKISTAQQNLNAQSEEFRAAWSRVAESISNEISGDLAPALFNVFARGHSAMDEFGNAAGAIVRNLTIEFTQLALKWLILKGITAAMNASAPGSGSAFGALIGGHATGSASSPGGVMALGEKGPERYRLPSGDEGIAHEGIYSVPKGTQVWPTREAKRDATNSLVDEAHGMERKWKSISLHIDQPKGHATGSVSSPGGVMALGEKGPERYRLPSGDEGIAHEGIYSIPKGTQALQTQSQSHPITLAPIFHTSGSNADDLARIIIPKMRSLVMEVMDSRGRTRDS